MTADSRHLSVASNHCRNYERTTETNTELDGGTQTNPINFSRYAPKAMKAALRAVGYALTLKDLAAMWDLSATLYMRLSASERAFLAIAVLWSLTDDEYQAVLEYMAEGEA